MGFLVKCVVEESPFFSNPIDEIAGRLDWSVTTGYSSKMPGSRLNTICAIYAINMGPEVGSSLESRGNKHGCSNNVSFVPKQKFFAQNEHLPTWILKNDPWVPSQMFPSKFLLYHYGATSENNPKTQNNNLETTVSLQGHVHPCHPVQHATI